jgi:hypothetical protein
MRSRPNDHFALKLTAITVLCAETKIFTRKKNSKETEICAARSSRRVRADFPSSHYRMPCAFIALPFDVSYDTWIRADLAPM